MMQESEGKDIHPEYGKLLYEQNTRVIKKSLEFKGTLVIIWGLFFLFISIMQFSFGSQKTVAMNSFVIIPAFAGCLFILYGFFERYRKQNLKFEVYEHGFIDHYWTGVKRRSGRINRYYVNYYPLKGAASKC